MVNVGYLGAVVKMVICPLETPSFNPIMISNQPEMAETGCNVTGTN